MKTVDSRTIFTLLGLFSHKVEFLLTKLPSLKGTLISRGHIVLHSWCLHPQTLPCNRSKYYPFVLLPIWGQMNTVWLSTDFPSNLKFLPSGQRKVKWNSRTENGVATKQDPTVNAIHFKANWKCTFLGKAVHCNASGDDPFLQEPLLILLAEPDPVRLTISLLCPALQFALPFPHLP